MMNESLGPWSEPRESLPISRRFIAVYVAWGAFDADGGLLPAGRRDEIPRDARDRLVQFEPEVAHRRGHRGASIDTQATRLGAPAHGNVAMRRL